MKYFKSNQKIIKGCVTDKIYHSCASEYAKEN